MLCIGRECLGRIKLQTHYIHINELPMQVKLAGESTLLDETIRFIQVDGGKIIDAHTQVDLANGVCLPGPIDEIRQHPEKSRFLCLDNGVHFKLLLYSSQATSCRTQLMGSYQVWKAG